MSEAQSVTEKECETHLQSDRKGFGATILKGKRSDELQN